LFLWGDPLQYETAGEFPVAKKASKPMRTKAGAAARPKKPAATARAEEQILQQGAIYCLLNFPTLWTVGGIKKEHKNGRSQSWIVAVHLRYPTGHEGYLGDLLYDGKTFKEVTDREVMRQRAKAIAADPERHRKWKAYRASTLQTGER
jgi:hypothetical protein